MTGRYKVVVSNRFLRYELEFKRNITIIQGDSATGKTKLISMIRAYDEDGVSSGIDLVSEVPCVVISGKNWERDLKDIHESIVFIDEDNPFVSSEDFAKAVKHSTNYYVLITRKPLKCLPYSIHEIYGLRESAKYGGLTQVYNEQYPIYANSNNITHKDIQWVVTEDTNAGYEFFKAVSDANNMNCKSGGGKSNLANLANTMQEPTLFIADGAAFGCEMEEFMRALSDKQILYAPESFEELVLRSNILKSNEILAIVANPCDYIESSKFFSWERYFTYLLTERTKSTSLAYDKEKLNPAYLRNKIVNAILCSDEYLHSVFEKV